MKESENMQTLQETQLETITAAAGDIADLLTGALIAADKGKAGLPSLAAVYLSATGGEVKAVASDRYRLIAGTIVADSDTQQELAPSAIRAADVKNILAAIKSEKGAREITFTRAGDNLSVAIGGVSLTLSLVEGAKFPPYEHLIPSESVAVEGISFNPLFMADFGKVPCSNKGGSMLTAQFSGDRKPIKVTIPHDKVTWVALLMPMRTA